MGENTPGFPAPFGLRALLVTIAVVIALTTFGISLLGPESTPNTLEPEPARLEVRAEGVKPVDLREIPGSSIDARAVQPDHAANAEPDYLPAEWEGVLFDILTDEGAEMAERNARLMDLATGRAKNIPEVQEVCLQHLSFSLSDGEVEDILKVLRHPSLPVEMREEFFAKILEMRPVSIGEWLSNQTIHHHEPAIRNLAVAFLQESKIPTTQDSPK